MSRAVRYAVAGILLSGLVAAGALDRLRGAPAPRSPSVRPRAAGGVWSCPIVAPSKMGAWLNLFNASAEASTVRVRWVRAPAKPVQQSLVVRGGTAVALSAPRATTDSGAGAIVEWGGGELLVSRGGLLRTLGKRTVATGGSCSQPGDAILVMPAITTLNTDAQVVLLNPSTAEALVDVSFLADGDEITPENARNRVVGPGSRLVVRVNDFVFDKQQVAAVVRVSTGAVVADAIVTGGVSSMIVPASAPRSSGILTAFPLGRGGAHVVAVGDEPTTVDATTITSTARGVTSRFPPGLEPFDPVSVVFQPASGSQAVSLEAREGSPFTGAYTWSIPERRGGDVTGVVMQRATVRWLGVIGAPAVAGRDVRVVIANPSDRPAVLRTRLFSSKGELPAGGLASITLPAGRSSSYVLTGVAGMPVGLEIVSDGVPVSASLIGRPGSGLTAVLFAGGGMGTEPVASVPILVDPRAGVDAP